MTADAHHDRPTSVMLEHLREVVRGERAAAPYLDLLGLRLESVDEGRVVVAFDAGPQHLNMIGLVHGGVAAGMLDTALGCAAQSVCAPGTAAVTVELKVMYLRPMTHDGGTVRATGTVMKPGRRIIVCEGRVEDAAGRLCAHATGTFAVGAAATG